MLVRLMLGRAWNPIFGILLRIAKASPLVVIFPIVFSSFVNSLVVFIPERSSSSMYSLSSLPSKCEQWARRGKWITFYTCGIFQMMRLIFCTTNTADCFQLHMTRVLERFQFGAVQRLDG